jgi:membrane protein implicated in regulation of membrane protease activity
MKAKVPGGTMWTWPVAVILGVATMCLAVVVAWIAERRLMALPQWAYPLLSSMSLVTAGVVVIVSAMIVRRRRRADRLHPSDTAKRS